MEGLGTVLGVVVTFLALGAVARGVHWVRTRPEIKRINNMIVDQAIASWCRDAGVPDVRYYPKDAAREVIAGTRPGTPRDGQWWIARGIEYPGRPAKTRVLFEGPAPDRDAVQASIHALYTEFGGPSEMFHPGRAEDYTMASIPGLPDETVWARVIGRYRPIGGWLVAVPPHLIGSGRRR